MGVEVTGGFRNLDPKKFAATTERSLDTVGIMLEGEVIFRANENVKTNIKEIRRFFRDEKKQDDMRKSYQNDKLKFSIGDIWDIARQVHFFVIYFCFNNTIPFLYD